MDFEPIIFTVEHRPSNIEHRPSNIDHRTSVIEHLTSTFKHRIPKLRSPIVKNKPAQPVMLMLTLAAPVFRKQIKLFFCRYGW